MRRVNDAVRKLNEIFAVQPQDFVWRVQANYAIIELRDAWEEFLAKKAAE